MNQRRVCVYNLTRECFLSLNVAVADTPFSRLRGMIGKLRLGPDEGVWLIPSSGVHTIGVLFPLDLVYLDRGNNVVHVIESFPRFHIAPLRIKAASVLELSPHSIYSSETRRGDRLLICAAEEIENRLKERTARASSESFAAAEEGSGGAAVCPD